MAKQTRRSFLKHTSASFATASVLTAVSGLTAACANPASSQAQQGDLVSTTDPTDVNLNGPIVAHVRNVSSGEITLLVGTQEFVYRDPELVTRLVKAIH